MPKKVMKANKKRSSEYRQAIANLDFFCLSLVREAFKTKSNPRTLRPSPRAQHRGTTPFCPMIATPHVRYIIHPDLNSEI